MNPLVSDHLAETYFTEYQELRPQLMALLTDADLAFRPGPATFTLGALCREIGEVEHSYVDALRTFRQDFAWTNPDPAIEHSVTALTSWYGELDRDLAAALEALTGDDLKNRRIQRYLDSGADAFTLSPMQELDIYREALLIFYAKVSIYLRLMGRRLPPIWQDWLG